MRAFLGGLGRATISLIFAGLLILVPQQAAVAAGSAVGIGFHYSSTTTEAGQCSAGVEIGLYDLFGDHTTADSLIPIALHRSGHVLFYSDSACSVPVTSVAILAGSSSVTFYFKDLKPETIILVGTTGSYGSVIFPMTITPATMPPPTATPVGDNPQWLVTILASLTIIGVFFMRKRMALQ
jgi:hypothetical protein